MRVLLVDDDALFVRAQAFLLGHHEVSTAASAREALLYLARAQFDVIRCDLHLPGVNGRQLHELLSVHAERLIFITGGAYARGDEELLCRHRWLQKPYDRGELEDAMQTVASVPRAGPLPESGVMAVHSGEQALAPARQARG